MNRVLYRRTAQTVRSLLSVEGCLEQEKLAEAFIYFVLSSGADKSGLPLRNWAWKPELLREQPCVPAELTARIMGVLDAIPSEDWKRRPELAGWLYQYMLEERKSLLYSGFKQGIKARAEDIPAVTQLFTPEWIARYMAENSVGRLGTGGLPGSALIRQWRYYDSDADDSSQPIPESRQHHSKPPIGRWKILDPACGCGHVLAAAFDVLLDIYREAAVADSEAVRLILGSHLYGLDIEPLAVQLCRFILLLKGARVDPALLQEDRSPEVYALDGPYREFGSLLRTGKPAEDSMGWSLLKKQYDAVITNPPYLGRRHMSSDLAAFLDREYPRSRNDLFAAFLERSMELLRPGGLHAAINQHAWMFLSGYEELRRRLLSDCSIVSLLHLGPRAFEDIGGEVVQTVCFILQKQIPEPSWEGVYWRLTEEASPGQKEQAYSRRSSELRFTVMQADFAGLPGSRIAYSLPPGWSRLFRELPALGDFYAVKKGMDTGGNDRYVRYWHEVPEHTLSFRTDVSGAKAIWYPYAKGGGTRRWYGNHYFVVKWTNGGEEIRGDSRSNLRNAAYYGKPGITWSTVSTGRPGFRLLEPGFLFDNGGSCLFPLDRGRSSHYALLAYLNSGVAEELLQQLNPTLNIQPGDVARLPADEGLLDHRELTRLGEACTLLVQEDWDESEWSWRFRVHPMAAEPCRLPLLEDSYRRWRAIRESRALRLMELEQEIDRQVYTHFVITPAPNARRREPAALPPLEEDAFGLLTYAAGCLTDYYPLGGKRPFREEPLLDWGSGGMDRLKLWLSTIWGTDTLDANLNWLADALGRHNGEASESRLTRYYREEWYENHLRRHSRRPVYARICSGRANAYVAYTPVGRLNRELFHKVLSQVEWGINRRTWEIHDADAPSDAVLQELRAYAERLRRFLEEYPDDLGPDSCGREIRSRYAPLLFPS